MEYFPLGNISSVVSKLKEDIDHIKTMKKLMRQTQTNEQFGEYRIPWKIAMDIEDKIPDCCRRLCLGIIDSLKCFHKQKLVHLDVKGILLSTDILLFINSLMFQIIIFY